MKKIGIYLVGAALLVSSCGTYTGQGAYAGATFGSILGSAIGGISGGWRGSDIGTIVGMAGGAAVGAAIGAAADQKQQEKIEGYHKRIEQRERQYDDQQGVYGQGTDQSDDSGFDATNSGDDRIDLGIEGPKGEVAVSASKIGRIDNNSTTERIVIRNARFIDDNQDGILKAGEECKISFEIMNYSGRTLYDVQPMVYEVTGNKNLHVSPNLHVESIAPNSGVRYTATILAGKKLKDGTATIRVGATVGNRELTAQEKEFTVVTRRK